MRFDEIELDAVPVEAYEEGGRPVRQADETSALPWLRHTLALLIDLSLFAALALALSPLLPEPATPLHLAALGGFVAMVSYYYFAGAWVLWGKTIGGAIFDVRVEARSVAAASARWAWMVGVMLVAGTITLLL
ncbi:MAG TPA: hypothetical protein VNA69_16045 [Thermoanaerobaculia bacterium]|nr:hypothetical protein [Thermoanaerobaculia bacterium]